VSIEVKSGGKPRKSNQLPDTIFAALPISEKLLMESAPQLEADVITLVQQLKAVENKGDVIALSRAFVALHRLREFINGVIGEERSLLSKPWNYYKTEAMDQAFDAAGMMNVPLAEGFRVQLAKKVSVSIIAERKEDGFKWLRDVGQGDLIKPTVHAGALSSAVQAMMEEDNVEPPSDVFTIHTARHASVVQSKKS
jgi:hypothetical protein